MIFRQILVLILFTSFLNCVFICLGYFAGKHFKIIEIKENETTKKDYLGGLPGPATLLNSFKKADKEIDLYPEESAYAVTPEDELKIDEYLRQIRDGKA